jgi:hypothetical protein
MEEYKIHDISPQMKAKAEKPKARVGKEAKYPWKELEIGKCFTVPDSQIKFSSLVTLAYRTGKKMKRVFEVVHHEEMGLYEVGYVRNEENEN